MDDAAENKYKKKIENLSNHISEMKIKIKSLEEKNIYYEREIFKLAEENGDLKKKRSDQFCKTNLYEENLQLKMQMKMIHQLSDF